MKTFILFLALCAAGPSVWAEGYNEVVDANGNLRPAYQGTAHYPVSEERVDFLLGSPLSDSIKIFPVPLILTREEYAFIQRAAVQRSRTILALYKDVIFNQARTVTAAKLVPRGYWNHLTRLSTQTDIAYIRRLWQGRDDKTVGVFHGSDLVRGEDGQFRVIEDNTGSLGGLGDVLATHEAMNRVSSVSNLKESELVKQIESFLRDIPRDRWSTEVVAIMSTADTEITSTQLSPEDEESVRKAQLVKSLGIPIVIPPDLKEGDAITPNVKKIVNFYDPLDYRIDWHAKKRLLDLFAAEKITFMVSPGVDWLGTKSLLRIMDQLTELYLNEKPLIQTQPTEWISKPADIDFSSEWVLKQVGIDQGTGVYLVGDLPPAQLKALSLHIGDWQFFGDKNMNYPWPFFVKQKKLVASYLPAELPNSWVRFNVDVRPLVYATDRAEILKPILWGRANMRFPGSKNNVSINAMEMVVTAPGGCEALLTGR